jgi:hypothetical protein
MMRWGLKSDKQPRNEVLMKLPLFRVPYGVVSEHTEEWVHIMYCMSSGAKK